VNVTPAVADRPAEFINPGSNAPRNGKATIKNRDKRTPNPYEKSSPPIMN